MLVGVPHRSTRACFLFTFRWGELACTRTVLPAQTVFQPWEPSDHARGDRVPITQGDAARGHGWGPDAPDGAFLLREEFEASCVPVDASPLAPGAPWRGRPGPQPTAFSELPTLLGLLRARKTTVTARVVEDSCDALEALARVHDWATAMELGASSFDNTHAMKHYASIADDVLAQARALWSTAHAITRD